MHRFSLVAFAAGSVVLVAAMPAAAQSARTAVPQSPLCVKAAGARHAVVKKHGSRAPGRNICRSGMRFKYVSSDGTRRHWGVREATAKEKAKYLRALRALNAPAPGGLARIAVLPTVPPAGTLSPGVQLPYCTWGPESGGNYQATNGTHFGKYQFDLQTWQSVGGTGNPLNASPAEQDKRAAMLYARRGGSPWVNC